jgi:hypothetical protein
MQAEIKDACWQLFDTEDLKNGPGPRLAGLVDHRITEMAAKYGATYPAAMKCPLAGREGLTACLRFPAEHHHRIQHPNFIERTSGETRRRAKAIGRLPGETSCLSLAWAVLGRAARGRRGLTMTAAGSGCCRTCAARCPARPASSGHAPSPRPRTTTAPRVSALSPNITMSRNRARPFYNGFRMPPTGPTRRPNSSRRATPGVARRTGTSLRPAGASPSIPIPSRR